LWAVFNAETTWADRAYESADWVLQDTIDLSSPQSALNFDPAEAITEIEARGEYTFFYQDPPTELEKYESESLNAFRLKYTIPIVRELDRGEAMEILGTGTLFAHEDRYFIVTADHIFREDENDPSSPLIDMREIAIPDRPVQAKLHTIGSHTIYRIRPPTVLDVIVLELLARDTIGYLKKNWGFLPFSIISAPREDDRFVISGFMTEGAKYDREVLRQRMLNLETDFLFDEPTVKDPAPGYDLYFYLQPKGALVDGSGAREITSLKGMSGGPIWAVRSVEKEKFWSAQTASKIVAVQSSEMAGKWSRGVHWHAVTQILSQPEVSLRDPPSIDDNEQ
jgi:hypothetical protein